MPTDYATRDVPATPQERRDAALSFGDQESIVYQALVAWLGDAAADDDGYIDIWICDLGTDWVVWRSWCTHGPGPGLWRLAYELDADNAVTFSGEPEAVVEITSYEPVEAKSAKAPARARRGGPAKAERAQLGTKEQRAEIRSQLRNVREIRLVPFTEFEYREVANGTGGMDLLFEGFASVTDPGDDSATYEMEDWLGPWTESVTVGAFRNTLNRNPDVAFLLNHAGMTLARTKPGTLLLSEQTTGDVTGLFSEARLDLSNLYVQAIRSAVERGDLDEMSFAFRVVRQEWSDDYDRRWINEVNIDKGDVSLVNYGANPHTGGLVSTTTRSKALAARALSGVDWRGYLGALTEFRAGATLSKATMATLSDVLGLLAAADDAVDEAQPMLAELMGVPNPDDPGEVDDADSADGDTGQLAAPTALDTLAMPNHIYDARARLAALRSGR